MKMIRNVTPFSHHKKNYYNSTLRTTIKFSKEIWIFFSNSNHANDHKDRIKKVSVRGETFLMNVTSATFFRVDYDDWRLWNRRRSWLSRELKKNLFSFLFHFLSIALYTKIYIHFFFEISLFFYIIVVEHWNMFFKTLTFCYIQVLAPGNNRK